MIFIMAALFLIMCPLSISSDPHIYSNLEDKSSVKKTGKGEEDYKTQPPTKSTQPKKENQKSPSHPRRKIIHNPSLQLWEFFLWVLLVALPIDTVPFQVLQIQET